MATSNNATSARIRTGVNKPDSRMALLFMNWFATLTHTPTENNQPPSAENKRDEIKAASSELVLIRQPSEE